MQLTEQFSVSERFVFESCLRFKEQSFRQSNKCISQEIFRKAWAEDSLSSSILFILIPLGCAWQVIWLSGSSCKMHSIKNFWSENLTCWLVKRFTANQKLLILGEKQWEKEEISWTHYWTNGLAGIVPIFRGTISFTSHWSQILWALAVDLSSYNHLIWAPGFFAPSGMHLTETGKWQMLTNAIIS